MKASVVLATYKERGNIVKLIKTIFSEFKKNKMNCEVVVVDDNSPDGTADAVRKFFKKNKNVKLIVRKNERGLGTAVGRGIKESKGDVIVLMDSDFSHDPKQIPHMAKLTDKYEIVSGSRYEKGGGLNTKFYRKLAASIMRIYITLLLQMKIKDYTNGFIAIRKSVLNKLDHSKIFYGYGDYYFRLYYFASKKGARIKEVPAYYKFREKGQSKTNILKHGMQYALAAIKLRFFS